MIADSLNAKSPLPRIAMVSTHGYVAASPPLGAADTGGQVVYVLELSKKLADLGYEVDIWTRRFEDQPECDVISERVRVIRAPCGGPKFIPKEYLYQKIPEWCENALRVIQRHRLRYEFINSHYWDAGVAGQRLALTLNAPHIHTPHSLGVWKQRQMEKDFPGDAGTFEERYNFARRIRDERLLYASCALVIATTPEQLDFLVRDYDVSEVNCRMIPPGYDDTRFYPVSEASRRSIRQRLGFDGKVIMAIGRIARNKGYDLLIDAFQLVAARFPDAVLHLAVGGVSLSEKEQPILAELQAQAARLNLADRIHFGGFIPDDQLADYYRAADAFVLSSRYEPFGMTAVEALACGTPTVVTTHGGLWRALTFGRHALFADPFDKEDLGISITKVFRHDRLRARMARMGAHKARSLFTWTGIAQQLVSVVEKRETDTMIFHDTAWDDPWEDSD
ncbi:MAG: glycosyltransferase [Verrucomicrobia subdivision 3 bacterium]|nr:glycosyltransferase [Limisphaerales bacterium]